jgi:ATP-dependent Lon protease
MSLDALDVKAAEAFDGLLVRKDLVRRFRGQFPVPTYVVEFMLGRYCASTDPVEIEEGAEIVREQLGARTVRAGEEELLKSKARNLGSTKLIDVVTARLDAKTDSFLATLPSLQLTDVRIDDAIVHAHERMLTGGFYAEVELGYDASIAQEKNGRPFDIRSLRPIQLSSRDVLEKLAVGRAALTTDEWKNLLMRSVGLEPGMLTARARDLMLLRMVPSWNAITTSSSLGPAERGRATYSSRSAPMRTLSPGARQPWRGCSSIWQMGSAAWSANTM